MRVYVYDLPPELTLAGLYDKLPPDSPRWQYQFEKLFSERAQRHSN